MELLYESSERFLVALAVINLREKVHRRCLAESEICLCHCWAWTYSFWLGQFDSVHQKQRLLQWAYYNQELSFRSSKMLLQYLCTVKLARMLEIISSVNLKFFNKSFFKIYPVGHFHSLLEELWLTAPIVRELLKVTDSIDEFGKNIFLDANVFMFHIWHEKNIFFKFGI